MSGMEIFAAAVAGLAGYTGANIADRFAATRDKALVGSPTAPIYKDWLRMGIGVGAAAVPLIGAHFVRSPTWRSGIQGFGLGALFHFGGKLIEDVSAMLLAENETGKKLYAGEVFAQQAQLAAEKQSTGAAGLPKGKDTAGLAGCGCDDKPEEQVPPPPAVGAGKVSPAALDAVKRHAPALRALGALAPHFNQEDVVRVQRDYAQSIAVLEKFDPRELRAAAGLAGLTHVGNDLAQPPPRESVLTPPAPAAMPPRQAPSIKKYNWAVGE